MDKALLLLNEIRDSDQVIRAQGDLISSEVAARQVTYWQDRRADWNSSYGGPDPGRRLLLREDHHDLGAEAHSTGGPADAGSPGEMHPQVRP